MIIKVWIFLILYVFSSIFYVVAKDLKTDQIDVIINDEIILNSDVNKIIFLLEKEGKNFRVPLKNDFLKEKVIEKLIIDTLILQEANKMNLLVTQEQINDVIKNIALKKNISLNELKNQIIFNSNFSYQDYLNNIKKSLKIKLVQDYELSKRVNVSEEKVNFLLKKIIKKNKYLKRINLSYIFLPLSKKGSNDLFVNKKILAENIVKKLRNGYDFNKLYADCKKNNTIFLAKKNFWMRLLNVQKNFSNSLNFVKKGQILGPFLKANGFYILKINDIINNKENILTEFYVQHCLIKPSVMLNDLEAKNSILNIYKNIKNQVYSFDYAVKNFSQDVYSSNKKGDLGWISKKFFNNNFSNELSSLKKNEISRPIKSNFGWHIFKLLKKRQVDEFYTLKKTYAYNILLNQKMLLEKHNWIQDLKNSAYIKIIES